MTFGKVRVGKAAFSVIFWIRNAGFFCLRKPRIEIRLELSTRRCVPHGVTPACMLDVQIAAMQYKCS
jgi:hypothetical protein